MPMGLVRCAVWGCRWFRKISATTRLQTLSVSVLFRLERSVQFQCLRLCAVAANRRIRGGDNNTIQQHITATGASLLRSQLSVTPRASEEEKNTNWIYWTISRDWPACLWMIWSAAAVIVKPDTYAHHTRTHHYHTHTSQNNAQQHTWIQIAVFAIVEREQNTTFKRTRRRTGLLKAISQWTMLKVFLLVLLVFRFHGIRGQGLCVFVLLVV